ncbi:two-component system response regulator BtsR [Vibrio brasiliensis]|jgi:two-component system LytT family response regulator|uniref:two-component system response regulator BtsR n=1 Tax=Vibrio brasiliensis TaxID=170652 RepID=UPI001EFD761C|nr:two-component system response regulator BtsR [Vibrio brasiliensis]MCG9650178.1 two-component system response regulator BtsR [Vibrio brasiliensis]MCG9727347.1 two-component system response regulator BtsR [Vibrio brasiliensis]MCG9751250.1 two-component system response regulator BtsR [Vibrio brasiliensis]MCG9784398.1 two-component system response regulator BtsR [Vibrio brasiliensis]
MLSALVIDDELFAREELTELLEETGHIHVIEQASNAIEGLKKINQLKPDVVFLDIQMPQITGIELLAMLDPETMPKVVFVTAYDEFAVQAFEDNAFDYLLKPVDTQRLEKTVNRLLKSQQISKEQVAAITPPCLDQVPCIGLNRIVIIPTKDVEFAYSDISGVHVQTHEQKATSQLTLKILEEKTNLVRCHRQFLVNISAIKEIKLLENGLAEIITVSDHPLPVSRRYLKTLKEMLGFH